MRDGIEFLDGDDARGDVEELAEPARPWPRLHRARVPLAIAFGLAVAAVAVLRILPSGSGDHPVAGPSRATPVPTPVRTFTVPFPVPSGEGGVVPSQVVGVVSGGRTSYRPGPGNDRVFPQSSLDTSPPPCRPDATCLTTATLPDEVMAAVRAAFPGAQLQSATNILADHDHAGSYLWYRALTVRVTGGTVVVVVRPPSGSDELHDVLTTISVTGLGGRSSSVPIPTGGPSSTSIARRLDRFTVEVQVDSPAGRRSDEGAIRTLSADRRLLVAG